MTSETGVIKIYLEMDFRMNEFTFATRNFFFIIYLIFFFLQLLVSVVLQLTMELWTIPALSYVLYLLARR